MGRGAHSVTDVALWQNKNEVGLLLVFFLFVWVCGCVCVCVCVGCVVLHDFSYLPVVYNS